MTPLVKGLVIAAVQVGIVASLGAKLLSDRSTLPRVWAAAAPFDPDLPIRGRYVSLQLAVELEGIEEVTSGQGRQQPLPPVTLRVEGDRLIAAANPKGSVGSSDLKVRFVQRGNDKLAVLDRPVAFFIPEHVPDPSRRPPGEQLWVEVTVPRKGPPRPIQLGVKKDGGTIAPLDLQ